MSDDEEMTVRGSVTLTIEVKGWGPLDMPDADLMAWVADRLGWVVDNGPYELGSGGSRRELDFGAITWENRYAVKRFMPNADTHDCIDCIRRGGIGFACGHLAQDGRWLADGCLWCQDHGYVTGEPLPNAEPVEPPPTVEKIAQAVVNGILNRAGAPWRHGWFRKGDKH